MTEQVAIVAKLTAQPGKRDELVNALKALLDATQSEPGTLIYAMHASHNDDNDVWFYERYADHDAFKAHSSSDAMKAVGPTMMNLLAGAPEITILTPVAAKGL
jgi:quinol monooxygenase YgiN